MSGALDEIIGRAVNDAAYRNLLLTDPDKALEGYQLSAEIRTMLEGLTEGAFDEFMGGLGDRGTKGWIAPG